MVRPFVLAMVQSALSYGAATYLLWDERPLLLWYVGLPCFDLVGHMLSVVSFLCFRVVAHLLWPGLSIAPDWFSPCFLLWSVHLL